MPDRRNVLTPEALAMMDTIARTGSFAAAARELGKVPSALTYNVRQLEDALDVLLFDRSSRQAQLTAAGEELLNEGRRLLDRDGRGGATACAAWPPAGRRSSPSPSTWCMSQRHDVRAVRGLLALDPQCGPAAPTRRARHAAAPAHRGAGRHLGGADQRPGRPGHRRGHAVGAAAGHRVRSCSASWSSCSRSRRTTRWQRTKARSAMPNCCATAPWRWPIRRSG